MHATSHIHIIFIDTMLFCESHTWIKIIRATVFPESLLITHCNFLSEMSDLYDGCDLEMIINLIVSKYRAFQITIAGAGGLYSRRWRVLLQSFLFQNKIIESTYNNNDNQDGLTSS